MLFSLSGDPPFDSVKVKIAHYESAHGKYRTHINQDGSVDLGLYQINSKHLTAKDDVGRAFEKIFKRFGISEIDRPEAVIHNDKLNEALARKLYQLRGLKAWTSFKQKP